MILCDSQIYFCIESRSGFCGNRISRQSKYKFLLIHRCGRKQSGFYPFLKPFRYGSVCFHHRFCRFGFVFGSVCFAITDSDHKTQFFTAVSAFFFQTAILFPDHGNIIRNAAAFPAKQNRKNILTCLIPKCQKHFLAGLELVFYPFYILTVIFRTGTPPFRLSTETDRIISQKRAGRASVKKIKTFPPL